MIHNPGYKLSWQFKAIEQIAKQNAHTVISLYNRIEYIYISQ